MTDQNQDTFEESQQRFRIEKSTNIVVYKFKQQLIPAWRPVPSTKNNLILYTILFLVFTGFGIAIFIVNGDDIRYRGRYDQKCNSQNIDCIVTFTLSSTIQAPVYFYYGLKNFYQSHRLFNKWKSADQLYNAKSLSKKTAQKDCGSFSTNTQMGWTHAVDNTLLNPDDVAFPCGIIAKSFFNDTFSIDGFPMQQQNIAWPYDNNQYKNMNLSKQGIDIKNNQHWLVWLRPSFTNHFYKLWGIINKDMPPGIYTLKIKNNYPLKFGQKLFQINGADLFGGTNIILGVAMIIGSGLSLLLFVNFLYQHFKQFQQKTQKKQNIIHTINTNTNVQILNTNKNGMSYIPHSY